MHILSESFAMFTYIGVWRPLSWDPNSKQSNVYRIYTIISVALVYTLTTSELMGAILLTKSLEDFTEISFVFVSTMSICWKTASILLRKQKVVDLADMLLDRRCLPRSSNEREILRKYDRIARYTSLSYLILAYLTVISMSASPLFQKEENRALPFRSWLPYDLSVPSTYWISLGYQVMAITVAATIKVANDTMICGFMMQACAQFELLSSRFDQLSRIAKLKATKIESDAHELVTLEKRILVECVKHHNYIFRYTDRMRSTFTSLIIVQFYTSSLVISLSVYQLSVKHNNAAQTVMLLLYLSSMIVELFIFCWFGNEVTLKSTEVGQTWYATDWSNFCGVNNLMIMMMRTRKPVVISCGLIIQLSTKLFINILKASYSAMNVLQRLSDN